MNSIPFPTATATPTATADDDTGGRHPVDIGHLVMGLAFLGLFAIWAVVQSDVVDGDDVRWLLPLPWVLAGAAGLLATTLRGVRRRPRSAGPEAAAESAYAGWSDTAGAADTTVLDDEPLAGPDDGTTVTTHEEQER